MGTCHIVSEINVIFEDAVKIWWPSLRDSSSLSVPRDVEGVAQ